MRELLGKAPSPGEQNSRFPSLGHQTMGQSRFYTKKNAAAVADSKEDSIMLSGMKLENLTQVEIAGQGVVPMTKAQKFMAENVILVPT